MTLLNSGSVLTTLTDLTQVNCTHALLCRVKDLSVNEFICLLDFITAEFQQFLRAIELINNESLETMLEKVLEAIRLKIGQILQAEHTTIFLVDYDKDQLWSKVPRDDIQKPIEIRTSMTVGIPGYVASTGESLNIPETSTHPLFRAELEKQIGYKMRNILCMPVFSTKNRVVAVVQLANKAGDVPFNYEDEKCFQDFASSIGIILESCQSFFVAARNQRGAVALLRATQTLGQSLDLEVTLQIVMEQARILMQADRSTLFLYRKEMEELWTKVAAADGKTMMEIRMPANRGIAGYVASTGEALNIPDAYKDPRFDPTTDRKTGYITSNILCLPVFNSANELIGVTQLINKQQGSFTASDEEFMRAFNIQAGIALENARLFENVLLEKQYQKDILQSLSDAVISTDMKGRIVTINDAALQLLGCPLEEANAKEHQHLWEQNLIGRLVWEVVPIDNLQMRLEDSLKTGARHFVPEQNLTLGPYSFLNYECQALNKAQQCQSSTNQTPLTTQFSATCSLCQTGNYICSLPQRNNDCTSVATTEEVTTTYWLNGQLHTDCKLNGSSIQALASQDSILTIDDHTQSDVFLPWNQPLNPQSVLLSANNIKQIERSINLTVNPLTNPEGGVRGRFGSFRRYQSGKTDENNYAPLPDTPCC